MMSQIVRDKVTNLVAYHGADEEIVLLTETGARGLPKHITSVDHELIQGVKNNPVFIPDAFSYDGTWALVETREGAVNAIISKLRNRQKDAVKAHGLTLVQAVFSAITNWEALFLVRDQYLSIAAAARSPTAEFQEAINIYQAGLDAMDDLNAISTFGDLWGYDPVSDPLWP